MSRTPCFLALLTNLENAGGQSANPMNLLLLLLLRQAFLLVVFQSDWSLRYTVF
jgi:hypothetical protein